MIRGTLPILASMRRRWAEYGLVAVAIAIVVAAVLVQRTLSASAQAAVHELAHQLGSNMLVVSAETDLGAFWNNQYGPEALPSDAPSRLRRSPIAPHLRSIESRLQATVRLAGTDVVLAGTDADAFDAPDGDVVPAIVTRAVAAAIGLEPGRIFDVQGVPVAITRVLDGVAGHPGDAIYVPLAGAQRILRRPGALNALRLGGCWCSVDVATLGNDVERTLPGTRAITVAGMLSAQKRTVAAAERYATLLQIGGALTVAVLVAAVVGSQARRRGREVALLSAIGANPLSVAALFTVEAGVAAAAGALLGHLFVQLAGVWIGTRLTGVPWTVSWDLLAPSIGITTLVATGAAAFPALRAAYTDVTTILREA